MNTEEEMYDMIDRYLTGELEGKMRQDFEELMENDPQLAAQVKLHREVGETIRNSEVFEFASAWDEVRKEFESPDQGGKAMDFRQDDPEKTIRKRNWIPWLGIAAAIMLFAVLAIWLWQGGKLQPHEVRWATSDRQETRTLGDGSQIELYPNSVLTYLENISEGERKMSLEGAGRFEVTRHPERPFQVFAGGTKTEVLGTIFTVRAYHEEDTIWIAVEEGRVSFSTTKTTHAPDLNLGAGDAGYLERGGEIPLIAPLGIPGFSKQKLIFDNTALSEVIEALEIHYTVKIELEDQATSRCPFSGPLEGKNIEEDLEMIKIITGLVVKKSGDSLFTIKGECR